jgi:hypothetical protein
MLVHHRDAGTLRLEGRRKVKLPARDLDMAEIRTIDASQELDARTFAGAVFPE